MSNAISYAITNALIDEVNDALWNNNYNLPIEN
jgi:hypothetical protein